MTQRVVFETREDIRRDFFTIYLLGPLGFGAMFLFFITFPFIMIMGKMGIINSSLFTVVGIVSFIIGIFVYIKFYKWTMKRKR